MLPVQFLDSFETINQQVNCERAYSLLKAVLQTILDEYPKIEGMLIIENLDTSVSKMIQQLLELIIKYLDCRIVSFSFRIPRTISYRVASDTKFKENKIQSQSN